MEEQKKEQKTESKKVKIDKGRSTRQKPKAESKTISFDAYFRVLMSKNNSVRPHHKAPMKCYVLDKLGKTEASKEEFEKILRKY